MQVNQIELNAAPSIAQRVFAQRESSLFLLLVGMVFVLSVLRPDTFFTSDNLFNISKQVSLISIVAIGQTLVIISGGIDLSVGFAMGMSGVILAYAASKGVDPRAALLLGLTSGTLVGLFNGFVVTKFRLPSFIVTLGTAKIALGIMYVLTQGYSIPNSEPFIIAMGNGYIGPVPIPTLILLGLVVVAVIILERTVFGSRIRAIGGNETAAIFSGINVTANKIAVFTLAGFFAAIAGVIMVGRVYAGNPNAGLNFELDSIAAAIIGGTALSGGEGGIIGTILGALLLGVITNGLILLNVSTYWQIIVTGGIIILVCALDVLGQSRKKGHG